MASCGPSWLVGRIRGAAEDAMDGTRCGGEVGRWTVQRSGFALAFLGVLVGSSLHDLFSAETVPLYGDLVFFAIPMKHFLATQMHLGEIPLWNPWIYMGTPFLAGLQTGV